MLEHPFVLAIQTEPDIVRLTLEGVQYAEYGISELEDPAVLQVQPFSKLGTPVEIARRFGSVAELRDAQAKLGELVYVA